MSTDVPAIGGVVGHFRLDALIGRGGMGAVYRAHDLTLDRTVALKLIRADVDDDGAVDRFRLEARIAARLREPHVVPLFDFGELDGRLFMAMQLVQGTDLAEMIESAPLPPAWTAEIIAQVADALQAAHAQGLVHRDVKPANILVADRDPPFAYLSDFGVAALTDRPSQLTTPGAVVGTMRYLAPERLQGTGDARADLYSLGCVLYEALVGHGPFPDDSVSQTIYAHLNTPPPAPSREVPAIGPEVDAVVLRAMAKDPAERYPSASEMALALRAAARRAGPGAGAPAVPVRGATREDPVRPSTPSAASVAPTTVGPIAPGAWIPVGGGHDAPPRPAPPGAPPGAPPFIPPPSFAPGGPPPGHELGDPPPFALLPPRPGRLRVRPDYRATSGPLPHGAPVPFLNNQGAVDAVRQRLRYAPGGSMLIAGFNGVGKTTVVTRALAELRAELDAQPAGRNAVLEVWQRVAVSTSPRELIIRLLRSLVEALERDGVLERIPPTLRATIDLAHRRTSMTLTSTHSDAREGSLAPQLTAAGVTASFTRKRTRTASGQEVYNPYELADAEYDFVRIVTGLADIAHGRRDVVLPRQGWRWRRPTPWRGTIVFVLDELDKLTADEGGAETLENLLRGLKNVLAASQVHFLFVAGADTFEVARWAHARGEAIWTSVFGPQLYLNCLSPGAAPTLLRAVLPDGAVGRAAVDLGDYLEYRSRGLPGLLIKEFDDHVTWQPDGPHIVVDAERAASIAFHAALQRRLGPIWAQARPRGPLTHAVDIDRRRAATYLVMNWVLSRQGASFTCSDLLGDGAALGPADTDELLTALTAVGILDRTAATERTVLGDPQESEPSYRLADSFVAAVHGAVSAPRELGRVGAGRYVLVSELGRGPLGRVYRARDTHAARDVAIKVLDGPAGEDGTVRERFRREVELARPLDHPLLATVLDATEDEGRLGLVSELIEGRPLAVTLARGRLHPAAVVAIAAHLADLLGYLHGEDIARMDLKPSNIVITPTGRPVVVELGLARRLHDHQARLTAGGIVIGTPLYLAPEAFAGADPDIRGDLYSLGLILYEMLAGHPARRGDAVSIVANAGSEQLRLDDVACSPALRSVLIDLVAARPAERIASPAGLAERLAGVPEFTSSPSPSTDTGSP